MVRGRARKTCKQCGVSVPQNRVRGQLWYYCPRCAIRLHVSPFFDGIHPPGESNQKQRPLPTYQPLPPLPASRPTRAGARSRKRPPPVGPVRSMAREGAQQMILRFIHDDPQAVYDLGVGHYSEYDTFREAWPQVNLYGCEPRPDTYQLLLPIFPGQLLPVAIGERSGCLPFHTGHNHGGGSLVPLAGGPVVDVEVWTLDQFDRWAGKPDRVLLWMDIEGGELAALRGGKGLLASGRVHWLNVETRHVVPEVYAQHGHPTTAQVDTFLAEFGYRRVLRYNVQGIEAPDSEAPGDCIYVKG